MLRKITLMSALTLMLISLPAWASDTKDEVANSSAKTVTIAVNAGIAPQIRELTLYKAEDSKAAVSTTEVKVISASEERLEGPFYVCCDDQIPEGYYGYRPQGQRNSKNHYIVSRQIITRQEGDTLTEERVQKVWLDTRNCGATTSDYRFLLWQGVGKTVPKEKIIKQEGPFSVCCTHQIPLGQFGHKSGGRHFMVLRGIVTWQDLKSGDLIEERVQSGGIDCRGCDSNTTDPRFLSWDKTGRTAVTKKS